MGSAMQASQVARSTDSPLCAPCPAGRPAVIRATPSNSACARAGPLPPPRPHLHRRARPGFTVRHRRPAALTSNYCSLGAARRRRGCRPTCMAHAPARIPLIHARSHARPTPAHPRPKPRVD
uniref:Uncharacterized protein n=1 Tax=Arundo donax TaxID=35708 RepID=A0A0A9AQK5_ARUDO